MKKYSRFTLKKELKGYAFIFPFLIGFLLFFVVPCVNSLIYSFGSISYSGKYVFKFIGIDNFRRALLVDASYNKLLLSAFLNVIKDVPIVCILSFIISVLIKDQFPGRDMIRVILFLPVIVSSGVIAAMDSGDLIQKNMSMITEQSGVAVGDAAMMEFLVNIGLTDNISEYIIYAVSNIFELVNCSGVQILLCLTALLSISPSLYEASAIEGATKWEDFWKITFPMVLPQLMVCAFYTVVNRMLSSSNSVIQYVYKTNFTDFELGFGSALAWLYFIEVVLVLVLIVGSLSKLSFKYNS